MIGGARVAGEDLKKVKFSPFRARGRKFDFNGNDICCRARRADHISYWDHVPEMNI